MNAHSYLFRSVVLIGFAVSVFTGSLRAEEVRQRLLPRPTPITAWTSEAPADCPFEKSEQFTGIVFAAE